MRRFLPFFAALFTALPASALTPAAPIQLSEWLQAVELDHPDLIRRTTPEVMLALANSGRIEELRPTLESPTTTRDELVKRQNFRSAIGRALRQLEKDGHLRETGQIDAYVFSDARNLNMCLEEPFHAARRLALNKRGQSLQRLCQTLLLNPNQKHDGRKPDETESTIGRRVLESQGLIDLLHEQRLLGRFNAAAAERLREMPDDFLTAQAWIYGELLLNGDSPKLWAAFEKAMPNQNTWRRDPLVAFAYFCKQRGIPAPELHQRAAEIVSSAPQTYSRLDGRHSAELDLLAVANAILTSDFDTARQRQKSAYEAYLSLDAKKRARFIEKHHQLLVDSFADPAVEGVARAWFGAIAEADTLAELPYESVLDLWEWVIFRDSSETVLGHSRKLTEILRRQIIRNPRGLAGKAGFANSLQRHIALMLDAGMIEEAREFHHSLAELPQAKPVLETTDKWVRACEACAPVILWRDTNDLLKGSDHWAPIEVGRQENTRLASLFPGPELEGTELGEWWQGRPAELLSEAVELRRRDGLLEAPLPEERMSAYLGLRTDSAELPPEDELQVVPVGPNLLPEEWMTAHRGLPGLVVWNLQDADRDLRIHQPLNSDKDHVPELLTPIITLDDAVNYSFSGYLRKGGSQASVTIRLEFLDADGSLLKELRVAQPTAYNSGPRNFFQVLLVRDQADGPALKLPLGTKALRLGLAVSGAVSISYKDFVLSRYALSNPEEIPKERENVDPLATTFFEFDHPIDAIATNPKHNELAVAIGAEGRIHVFPQGGNTPSHRHSLPKGAAIPWLASAEDGTIAALTLRPKAKHPVFYVFGKGDTPVVISTTRAPLLPTLDRKGRWMLWMDEEDGRRFMNYHDLRHPDAETVRRHLDIDEDMEVLFIASIWTNDTFALAGSDFRIDYSLPEIRQKRILDGQKPLGPREFGGFYRTQNGTFLSSRCELHPFPGFIANSQGLMTINSPDDASIKTLDLRSAKIERSADFSSPVALALPIAMRKGFLERDLLFTLKDRPNRLLRFDRKTLAKVRLTL